MFGEVNFVVHNIARLIVLCNHFVMILISLVFFLLVCCQDGDEVDSPMSSPSVVVE